MKRTLVLMILDGWGIGESNEANPVYAAHPATFAELEANFPVTSLQASGISVGLPWGEVGNSEVGHITIGAGKVVYQYYPRIEMAIQDGSFFENPVLKAACDHAKKNHSNLNLVGLLSGANVHASIDHLLALDTMAKKEGVETVNFHLWSDGKDSPPRSLDGFLGKIPAERLASMTGRYYAMDRMENWSLIEKAYGCLVGASGQSVSSLTPSVIAEREAQLKGMSEEYLPPLRAEGRAIEDNDAVVFFNFREDGVREIASVFTDPNFNRFERTLPKNLHIATMTHYSEHMDVPVIFPPEAITKPLGLVLAENGKTQLRLAESYKYAHATYFFNGYQEEPFKGEYRAIVPSLTAVHADEHPELQAKPLTDRVVEALQNNAFDFVLVNYSNPDTIAHTGNYEACVEAVRVIDHECARVVKATLENDALLIITADHGNIEQVVNPATGKMESQHDPNPVPFYLVGSEFKGRKFPNSSDLINETVGILADVAPTILELMGIAKPKEMTGRSLLRSLL